MNLLVSSFSSLSPQETEVIFVALPCYILLACRSVAFHELIAAETVDTTQNCFSMKVGLSWVGNLQKSTVVRTAPLGQEAKVLKGDR